MNKKVTTSVEKRGSKAIVKGKVVGAKPGRKTKA